MISRGGIEVSRAARGALASLVCATVLVSCGSKGDRVGASSTTSASSSAAPSSSVGSTSSASPSSASLPSAAPTGGAVDATSGASATYASGGEVAASGEVDVGALRRAHKERIAKDTGPVTLLRGDGALDLGERICEAVVPKRPEATPILLKPNICGFDAMKDASSHGGDDGVKGRTTSPEFVRGVVRCLKKRGHTHLTIAEGCSLDHRGFEKLMSVSGYAAMAKEEGVVLVAMDDDGTYDAEGEQPGKPVRLKGIEDTPVPKLLLPKIVVEHLQRGLFISLPKVKTHRYSVFSLAVKGMQGVVMTSDAAPAHQQKWRMHRELMDYLKAKKAEVPDDRAAYVASLEAFADRMAAVLEIAAPDVILADGAPAEGGDGFGKLVPYADHFAIGGTSPILVDEVGARMLGLFDSDKLALGLRGHKTSPLLEAAAKRFGVALGHASVTGDGEDLLRSLRAVHFEAIAPFAIDFEPPRSH